MFSPVCLKALTQRFYYFFSASHRREPDIVASLFFTIIKRVANDLLRNALNGGLSFSLVQLGALRTTLRTGRGSFETRLGNSEGRARGFFFVDDVAGQFRQGGGYDLQGICYAGERIGDFV